MLLMARKAPSRQMCAKCKACAYIDQQKSLAVFRGAFCCPETEMRNGHPLPGGHFSFCRLKCLSNIAINKKPVFVPEIMSFKKVFLQFPRCEEIKFMFPDPKEYPWRY
jgi:hypothetical protein